MLSGCETQIQSQFEKSIQQVYVENFSGNGGEITTDIIKIHLKNAKFLTKEKTEADLIITGSTFFSPWSGDNITFFGKNQKGDILLSGNTISPGGIISSRVAKEAAKKIVKKLKKSQKNLDNPK